MGKITTKALSAVLALSALALPPCAAAQTAGGGAAAPVVQKAEAEPADTAAQTFAPSDSALAAADYAALAAEDEGAGLHQVLKTKFIEGNAGFMSLVAITLVLGLAFCIERMIYLSISEIDAKKFMARLRSHLGGGDLASARRMCEEGRGPVAAMCGRALDRMDEGMDTIERAVTAYGTVQAANLEKGCSWISLFIAMAPSLGFLGTVVGMVLSFDDIQAAGDISPTIVASGMKVALITTIFGIIVALVLQVFYNYVLSKIEHIVAQMEESAIQLLEGMADYKRNRKTDDGKVAG